MAAPAGARPAALVSDAITATAGGVQALPATSGVTTVYLPRQTASGERLRVLVHTLPHARVRLIILYPDGTTFKGTRHADDSGNVTFTPLVNYQPQGSTELATITVQADLRRDGLADVVSGSIAISQHEVVQALLRLPPSVVAGRRLPVELITQPGATVRFVLVYPDGQVQHYWGGYVDASGVLTKSFFVSRSDGTRGMLYVEALVSYNGVERHFWKRVALRAPNS